ncbi:hypothetical protein SEA_JACOREN57_70 [Mycobacterium phage JacoRen57]|nr:hypothetical protein SEA_JACOREN57_70 [Mycobacterium phage JacoRen57]
MPKMFSIEFYRASDIEESDPDPMYVIEADNTDDLLTQLETALGVELTYYQVDVLDEDLENGGGIRYNVYDGDEFIGVALVVYP